MKIVQINATCGVGSTGKICVGISELLTDRNVENYILYSYKSNGYSLGVQISNEKYIKVQSFMAKFFGNYGFNSKKSTRKIIEELERIKPDIVHLHNIHGHDCDLKSLFEYFKMNRTKLIWTFHDCWAFTGYCTYFDIAKCNKWKTLCRDCPQKKAYSWFLDRSKANFLEKKRLFMGLDLTIVVPSQWLAEKVKESFFKSYSINVIKNGIDLSVFQPTKNSFKEKRGIPPQKKIVLGVAFGWGERKGLDVFIKLAKSLDNLKYQVVLVGTNAEVEKQLPSNVLSIRRTQNQHELAEIYSAADVFVNPTREEVLGLTNIEANACGTPVITFRTGGSPECIDDLSGVVVDVEDIQSMAKEIVRICQEKPFDSATCRERAKLFNKTERFEEYVRLYESFNT